MGIITISRGSYSKGKEIAEKLAATLNYSCISRDIILETSEQFHIPELKLVRAIHDAPSTLDRFKYGKEKFVIYIQKTLLEHVRNSNVVYHGLAGHFLLQNIPNVLKVRIIANCEDRVIEEMRRENLSEKEARHILAKDDQERRKWSLYLYGIDTNDANLYDIVLHIDNLKVADAVSILTDIARLPPFQETDESKRILEDQYIAASVKAALIETLPSVEVKCKEGVALVTTESPLNQSDTISTLIGSLTTQIDGLKDVRINLIPTDMD